MRFLSRPLTLQTLSRFLLLLLVLASTSCGFHLRGSKLADNALFQFKTLYIDSPPLLQPGQLLATYMKVSVKLVDRPEDAQVVLKLYGESTKKNVLTIDGAGRLREYTLNYQLDYQVIKPYQAMSVVRATREFSYDDTKVLAKESEEQILFGRMQEDATQQIVRVLSSIDMSSPAAPTPLTTSPPPQTGSGDTGPKK